jgi:S-adenosylmethionine/arginine decarboxylase-like enzyme
VRALPDDGVTGDVLIDTSHTAVHTPPTRGARSRRAPSLDARARR